MLQDILFYFQFDDVDICDLFLTEFVETSHTQLVSTISLFLDESVIYKNPLSKNWQKIFDQRKNN